MGRHLVRVIVSLFWLFLGDLRSGRSFSLLRKGEDVFDTLGISPRGTWFNFGVSWDNESEV